MGKDQRTAALHGRNEIGFAALSITMVDIVVFLPMSFITGIIGDFLREYALVVVFSTSMSLLVSFTITPMLASRFSRIEDTSRKTIFNRFSVMFERFFSKITSYYTRLLKWSLAHWSHGFTVVATAILLLVSSIYLFPAKFIGVEFMPNVDRDELILTIEAEPGSTVLNTNRLSVDIEKILWTFPEVERVLTSVGTSSEGSGLVASNYNNTCEYTISLLDKSKRKESTDLIGQRIKQKVLEIPGVKARVSTVGLMGSQNMTPIQILVTGTTFEDVYEGARIISDVTKSIQGTSDVRLSTDEGKPEIQVNIDRNKIAALGLSIMDVGQNLRIALTGDDESKFREGITEYDIRIMLDQFDRSKTDNVSKLTFINNKGQPIELQQFADVAISTGPTKLERQDRIRAINIYSQVLGSTSGVVSQIIDAKMKSIKLPPGVSYQYTGQQKYMMESFISLFVALGAGILFVYMIMVALYDSFVYPFVVLFSIPVAIIGALYGLALTNKSMSIYSMLGIIMLVGLVAKNAILLVDRTNQMKKEQGLSTFDALIEAAQTRLRPILMTTFAMVMGMSPIALSTSAGSEAKSGLAVVLIGGLLSSMFLTLLLVPVVYQSMDKLRIWIPKVFKRLLGIKEKAEELSVNTES
jgi:HAE1 family hydrophobic/amphiphilic exporter-1